MMADAISRSLKECVAFEACRGHDCHPGIRRSATVQSVAVPAEVGVHLADLS